MIKDIIGRTREQKRLKQILTSKKAEFLAIYGRRRVGKTFLVKKYFNLQFNFYFTGVNSEETSKQLYAFHDAWSNYSNIYYEKQPANWLEAFDRLKKHLISQTKKEKKIIFIDEMPWLDTVGSDFVLALEYFWNSWAGTQKNIVLIACGSAASWMINELINNTGGLHNRVTQQMKVLPFDVEETEAFLKMKNMQLSRYQIAEIYMAMGGIPFYLEQLQPEFSAAQNIALLFFNEDSPLRNEFYNLYRSLFKKYQVYEKVVEALSKKHYGVTRTDIVANTKLSSGGTLTKVLNDLEESGFIKSYDSLDLKNKNTIYRLSDYYSLFYFKFCNQKKYQQKGAWLHLIDNAEHRVWQGLTFEQLCMDHIDKIKNKLGISGIMANHSAWRGKTDDEGLQIDLLIDRRDEVINICEIKFSLNQFVVTKEYAKKLREKVGLFKEISKTKKAVFLTLLSSYGVKQNSNSIGLINNEVVLDDLF